MTAEEPAAGEPAPPDLRLEWLVAERGERRAQRRAPDLTGPAGQTVRLRYRVRNVGGTPAFAVLLSTHTTLGLQQRPERLAPGPQPGSWIDRHLDLPLALGMREVCIEAALQSRAADEPQDPRPEDNRLCRKLDLAPAEDEESGTRTTQENP